MCIMDISFTSFYDFSIGLFHRCVVFFSTILQYFVLISFIGCAIIGINLQKPTKILEICIECTSPCDGIERTTIMINHWFYRNMWSYYMYHTIIMILNEQCKLTNSYIQNFECRNVPKYVQTMIIPERDRTLRTYKMKYYICV